MAFDLNSLKMAIESPAFWDAADLEQELRRQYDVCHGCRLCLNLCPAYPSLFDCVDQHDGDVEQLTKPEVYRFVDLCYECKLCFLKCPYNPPHEFMIDIPKVVLRAKAVKARDGGISLKDRALSTTDLVGRVAGLTPRLANWANKNKLNRVVLEKAIGIHRKAILPLYHKVTFERWWQTRPPAAPVAEPRGKVALFYTCIGNYNTPHIAQAVVDILEHNEVEIVVPDQRCCGMPYLDAGDMDHGVKNMRFNLERLAKLVDEGYDIVVPEPTCGMMLKQEYKDFVQTEEAEKVANATYDIHRYLIQLNRQKKLKTDFKNPPGKIAYHMSCHLRYQRVGQPALQLLKLIPGAEVEFIDRGCSGHDGTWGMKAEWFELGQKVGAGLFQGVNDAGAELVATECSLAGLQIETGTGRQTVSPIEILHLAYGLNASNEQ